jgi:hypothetical protein
MIPHTANNAADVIKASSSTALKGKQDFNNKFFEFAHTNTNAAFDFVQRLHGGFQASQTSVPQCAGCEIANKGGAVAR